ncbi:TPA: AbrB/MazE/SpoVT family DNA-binding domain-containing protein [Escherichia coli]|uniref:AbrB/MazE/SpoVT family DNA-binding domain-containing protein n=1 Tax=Escherichia coli TaxID=562 RepID=UPI001C4035A8|nr:AbrB/MazE/SpoVT family DNA-binding domain-containing protein [Escherichia coli]HAX5209152.1 AbrB/MazE/SpoVT family DNA-binding domain-containing protein [Escherichia coli]
MVQVVIKKWGNSPAVRLPGAVMKSAELHVNDVVNVSVEDGLVTIRPVTPKKYSLDDLLAGITPENIHERVDFGRPVGRELL